MAIITDATDDQNDGSLGAAEEAFLKRMKKGAATLPDNDTEEEEADESEDEDEDGEGLSDSEDEEEDDNDQDEDDQPSERKYADEDAVVKVKVNGVEQEFKVKDLSRLAGQEAALTQRSQEVAALRKQHEEISMRNVAAADALKAKALERYEPYARQDWSLLAASLPEDQYIMVRDEALKAYQDVQFFTGELDNQMKAFESYSKNNRIESAKAAVAECLKPNSPFAIKGFDEKVLNEMAGYVGKLGIDEESFLGILSPASLSIIHKALLYDRGQKAVSKTQVVSKSPKKIVKSTVSSEAARSMSDGGNRKAIERLRRTGSMADAEAAFLSRFSKD